MICFQQLLMAVPGALYVKLILNPYYLFTVHWSISERVLETHHVTSTWTTHASN